mmetsp:Transcript_17480/g.54588  ORF Transcript_17480/g.54588 Transcript_17480/m.54588 type:complete len:83 (-) Transcript_17480:133-381(-)
MALCNDLTAPYAIAPLDENLQATPLDWWFCALRTLGKLALPDRAAGQAGAEPDVSERQHWERRESPGEVVAATVRCGRERRL